MDSIKLFVQWSPQAVECFRQLGFSLPLVGKPLDFRCPEPPFVVQDLAQWLESLLEAMHYKRTGQQLQVQVYEIRKATSRVNLPFGDMVEKHFKPGETMVVDMQAQAQDELMEPTEEEIAKFRSTLRFDLNDRVLCNCGDRWLAGLIVGTGVAQEGELLPYVVKTDPIPGIPSRTISVPSDSDEICVLEVCFDATDLELTKCSAPVYKSKPRLRFAANESVVVRIRNEDDLENWVPGVILALWPELPGPTTWEFAGMSGRYANNVPYKVGLSDGHWIFCHKDHHTLIRRVGMEPQTKVRGISKRLEVRLTQDGQKEQVDHQTERRKIMQSMEDDSTSDED